MASIHVSKKRCGADRIARAPFSGRSTDEASGPTGIALRTPTPSHVLATPICEEFKRAIARTPASCNYLLR